MTELFLAYDKELHEAIFLNRPNRFILTCMLKNSKEVVTVHLPDPGRLKELLIKNRTVYLSHHDNPNRKTKWSAELVKADNGTLVSLRSTLPNDLVKLALEENALKEFSDYTYIQREFTYRGSRWDFLIGNEEKKLALEVKSVTLAVDGVGYFPDAITKRGARHVTELGEIYKEKNFEAALLFICQREDIKQVKPASWIDPVFTESLVLAQQIGVPIYARQCKVTLDGIYLGNSIPVKI